MVGMHPAPQVQPVHNPSANALAAHLATQPLRGHTAIASSHSPAPGASRARSSAATIAAAANRSAAREPPPASPPAHTMPRDTSSASGGV